MTKTQKVIKGKLNIVEKHVSKLQDTAIKYSFKSETHSKKIRF